MNGKTFSMKNVCTEVVANDLCIGCGICAGLCPSGALDIEFNGSGEYVARVDGARCREQCSICLRVCPFADREDDESTIGGGLFGGAAGIRHTPETGYYLGAFVGYSTTDGHRENGASGGMATWTLEMLLEKGMVDYAVCVAQTEKPGRLFEFVHCDTPGEVRDCSRSAYYPVEM
ncbi:MAG: 4Fe-4S dicluster domain-containing protein, partial [Candidatus Omnitrophica bacterium]|nr:4Fe-4S dicluster domain-containing protein [Candidatus Omnitrophota bacterium]